jgi:putative tryptophan/tyrosine transport system substrate-binding protein
MKRRDFITLLGGAAVASPLRARGQQQSTKLARIGFLRAAGPDDKDFTAFRSGLRALGYVEGQNIVIEQRYAAGSYDRVGELAAELVRLNVDVIVVDGPAAAKPAKEATADIPIVFTLATDPVADGLVASMARPGGNLTGLTLSVGYELVAKRVELLKDIKPDLARLAILRNPANPSAGSYLSEAEKAGRALGLTMRTFDARSPRDLEAAFAAMVEWRADGVATLNDGMLYSQRERVVTLARENRLVGVHPETVFVEAGGLISYGPSLPDLFRRAASYVAKILKGEKPADLPIEQPTKFELVVNLKTARALGLTISRDFLLRADEVIE